MHDTPGIKEPLQHYGTAPGIRVHRHPAALPGRRFRELSSVIPPPIKENSSLINETSHTDSIPIALLAFRGGLEGLAG
jgi:hypothetical protein